MTIQELNQGINKAIDYLSSELSAIHTGRASTALVDGISVEVYGQKQPLKAVANVSVSDARSLSIQPWDKSNLAVIEKAIRESSLGLNPVNDGNVVRINIPDLTEERRKDYIKVAREKAEDARISIRNLRRDILESFKKQKTDGDMSENDYFGKEKEVQKLIQQSRSKTGGGLPKDW